MKLRTYTDNAVTNRIAKASEAKLSADERRGAFILGDDPVEIYPALAHSKQVEHTDCWTTWDRVRFMLPWSILAVIVCALVDWFCPAAALGTVLVACMAGIIAAIWWAFQLAARIEEETNR